MRKYLKNILLISILLNSLIISSCNNSEIEPNVPSFTQEEFDEFEQNFRYTGSIKKNDIKTIEYIGRKSDVVIPNFVRVVGTDTFKGKGISSLTFGNNINLIEKDAFISNDYLSNVYYEGSVDDWCNIKFENLYATPMCTVIDPTYVFHPGYPATRDLEKNFYLKNNNNEWEVLTHLAISSEITEINDAQFKNINSIKTVIIPNSIKKISQTAFYNCKSIEEISLPFVGANDDGTGNHYFGYIFGEISELQQKIKAKPKKVIITGNSDILESAFGLHNTLKYDFIEEIKITGKVERIEKNAFNSCTKLFDIYLPNSIKYIGETAFKNCHNIRNFYYAGNIDEYTKIEEMLDSSLITEYAENIYVLDSNNEYININAL